METPTNPVRFIDHPGFVSRTWLTEVVSVEETSTKVELGFPNALQAEGLLERVDAATTTAGSTWASATNRARCCSRSRTTARK